MSAEYLLSHLQIKPMIDVNLGNPTCLWGPGLLQSLQRLEMSHKCAMHSRGVCDTDFLSLGEGPFRSVSVSPDAGFTDQGRQGPLKGRVAALRGIMLIFMLVCAILIPILWVLPRPHDTLHLQIRRIVYWCAFSYVALFYISWILGCITNRRRRGCRVCNGPEAV